MKRKTNITLTAVALALFGWQAGAVADTATPPKTKISLEAAQKAALAAKPGKVVKDISDHYPVWAGFAP